MSIASIQPNVQAMRPHRATLEAGSSVPQDKAEAVFAAAIEAVQSKNFAAFKKLLHPELVEFAKPGEIAGWFAELTAEDMTGWALGPVEMGPDGAFAEILNARQGAFASFDYDGDVLKLVLMGVIEF